MDLFHLKLFIQGIVQGVGFRPTVYNLAKSLNLKGYILNDSRGVLIELEGEKEVLEEFRNLIVKNPPPLANIQKVEEEWSSFIFGYNDFSIKKSQDTGEKTVLISPDIAVCDDCRREMEDPQDPRFNYPFINCTNCGPRFTIIMNVPYDRPQTTMKDFPLCDFCESEYQNPSNRRFHAQPVACPHCGPEISLIDSQNRNTINGNTQDIIDKAVNLLKEGKILAIKGLGGYHLSVSALNDEAVKRLRSKKYREDKPFALMGLNIEMIKQYCMVSPHEEQVLTSHYAPIVLLRRRDENGESGLERESKQNRESTTRIKPNSLLPLSSSVAPGNRYIGFMLPYTPLHHLIMNKIKIPLVMTSGNVSDEPIAYKDEDAFNRLSSIADYFLIHNRKIHIRTDDSVVRVFQGREYPLRRSRGYVPFPVILKRSSSVPVLAVGGELKSVFCLYRNNQAFLSHHIGDLENIQTLDSFEEGIKHFCNIFDIHPEIIAYDPHPCYLSTQWVFNEYKENTSIKKVPVQHHHAHIASVMADNNLEGKVIGVALDGVGYGNDCNLWGFEFMIADYISFERKIHLKYIPLPGGEKAIKEPWRMALSYLWDSFGDNLFNLEIPFLNKIDTKNIEFTLNMIKKRINSPLISSGGRLFDAVSSLMGIRSYVNFEGQSAIELEMLSDPNERMEYTIDIKKESNTGVYIFNPFPLLADLIKDIQNKVSLPTIGGRFHNTLARWILKGVEVIREESGLNRVGLSGGVFQNMLLLTKTVDLLKRSGFDVYIHGRVPTNDGGISLGQAVVISRYCSEGLHSLSNNPSSPP